MTGPAPDFRTVHAPLAWWARHTPDALALDDRSEEHTSELQSH